MGMVNGELRCYMPVGPDSLLVFALREDAFVPLETLLFPPIDSDAKGFGINAFSARVAPDGCIHHLWAAIAPNHQEGFPTFMHTSSCQSGNDTVPPPPLADPRKGYPSYSDLRFLPDGGPMFVFTGSVAVLDSIGRQKEVGPNGIYAARLKAGAWRWEAVAEF